MRLIYVAHPYSGNRANLERARRWLAWLWRDSPPDVGYVADWIFACEILPETPENRARGLAFDAALVSVCDEFVMVGGTISPGMHREHMAARAAGLRIFDLTHLGPEPPAGPPPRFDRFKPGDSVIYVRGDGTREEGIVASFSPDTRYAFVMYNGDTIARATLREDLELVEAPPC